MLTVNNLEVIYDTTAESKALCGVSFSMKPREHVALIGANGAGKSSLLLSLSGVITAASGSITLDGIGLKKDTLTSLRQRVGMVFQNPDDQLFMPSVYEDIAFGPRNFGHDEANIEIRMDRTLEALGIAHLKHRMAHKLSGGEKRLVTLAGVLVMDPLLLLMDEPSSFLDPRARKRLISILKDLSQAIILATHDLDMALDMCDRTILLKNGRVCADGPSEEILLDAKLLDECGLELPYAYSTLGCAR